VLALLLELKQEQTANYGTLMPTAYIFNRITDPYKPQYPTEPTRWQSRFVKRHGLPDVSPHDLRHTAATLALEGGADLKQVQQLLGHKDPATTMKFYAGVSEEQQRRTVEGIEKLLG
jgi:integrase